MGSIYDYFYAEMTCRICKRPFCCKDCRRKHEVNIHNIHPDCHVCLYGVIPISLTQTTYDLRDHLQARHFPLYCVKCSVVFETLQSIAQHNFKCTPRVKMAATGQTPMRPIDPLPAADPASYQSPDTVGVVMTTSTPLTENAAMINLSENITPVDNDRIDPGLTTIEKSTTKRVTFLTTPAPDHVNKKRKNPENLLKSSLKKTSKRCGTDGLFLSQTTMEVTTSFATAKDHESGNLADPSRPKTKRLSHSMNDTMWLSAINESFPMDSPTEIPEADNTEAYVQESGSGFDTAPQEAGVWASMTTMFRNVVKSFNSSAPSDSLKRSRSMTDFDKEESVVKRQKLCDIRCRPPIRPSSKRIVPRVNKSIQTDF